MADGFAIDPMSAASPDLPAGDMDALRDSIRQLGQLVPIVVYDGRVIDGRKRLAACEALGITPRILKVGGDDPTAFAAALNLLRTHYSVGARALYAETLATLKRGQHPKSVPRDGVITPSGVSAAEAGARFGVDRKAVDKARAVRRRAIPAVVEAVERGKLSLHAAGKIAAQPAGEQAHMLKRTMAAKRTSRRLPPGTLEKQRTRERRVRAPIAVDRLLTAIAERCAVLDPYVVTIGEEVEEEQRATWLQQIADAIRVLRSLRRQLREEEGNHE
jgi:hypothetical protein